MTMPVLFIAHGSPMNAIEHNSYTLHLHQLGQSIGAPKGILMISAHWMTKQSALTAMDKPKTIHDFYGFPDELFAVQYPAPGDVDLAKSIAEKIDDPHIHLDQFDWGLDHGTWSVLKHMYPKANVPVVQLSLDMTKPASYHYELGKKISYLREQGILIMGSGNIVHNLRQISWNPSTPAHSWAVVFDQRLKQKLETKDHHSLVNHYLDSTEGQLSNPTQDHYYPFLYTLGASSKTDQISFTFEGFQNAAISMRCILWN